MSIINRIEGTHHHFLLGDLGDGTIGFDGMGPIDYEASDVEVVVLRVISRLMDLEEARIVPNIEKPRVVLRRGVKEFDLAYDYRRNVFLISSSMFSEFSEFLDSSLTNVIAVDCHFGSKVRNYYFANLKSYFCWKEAIIWQNSTFMRVDRMKFDINRTEVERGEVSIDHEVSYDAFGLTFDNADMYFDELKQLMLQRFIPERLALKVCPPREIINLSSGQTLVGRNIVEALRNRSRPKLRVPGMCFSNPVIPVYFEYAD